MKISSVATCFIIFWVFNITILLAQYKENLIKTSEYNFNNVKRRDLYLDSNLSLKKEDYFDVTEMGEHLYKLASVEYKNEQTRKKVTIYNQDSHIVLFVDFDKGIYNDYTNKIFLKFKGDFIFDGLQRGDKIVVNYKNGIRNGRLIQTDSAVNGSKTMMTIGYDPRYLQFDIIRFYNQPISVATYKLFNGIELNYEDGELNGFQKMYYSNSKPKFLAEYNNFRLNKFSSFSKDGAIISRLVTENGFTNKNQLINGTVSSDENYRLFYLRSLSNVGSIVIENNYGYRSRYHVDKYYNVLEAKFNFKSKLEFDSAKKKVNCIGYSEHEMDIQDLLGIPKFRIVKYDLETSDDLLINSIFFAKIDTTGNHKIYKTKLYEYEIYWDVIGDCDCGYVNLSLPFLPNESNHGISFERKNQINTSDDDNVLENDLLKSYLFKAFNIELGEIKRLRHSAPD